MKRTAFSLIEILVVISILGLLSAMVVPAYKGVTSLSEASLNKVVMQNIKKASLAFKKDVGFVPDNVALLIFPYEECKASEEYNASASSTCKNMTAFVDSRMTQEASYRIPGEGDLGVGMRRKPKLNEEINRRLNPKENGWRGSYIGANEHLRISQTKTMGGSSSMKENKYFLPTRTIELYYEGFEQNATLDDVGVDDYNEVKEKWFCVESTFGVDDEIAKYRKNLAGEPDIREGELTILDQWGTPYEIQFPSNTGTKSRERFARVVSFGENRLRDTDANTLSINYKADGYDDSVLYMYENNQTNYFHMAQ